MSALAPAVAAPATQPPATQTPPADQKKTWTEWYNDKWVDWTAKNTLDCVKTNFSIKTTGTEADPADGTLKKVAKVFFMLLSSIVLFPLALVGATFNWIKNGLCPGKKDEAATSTPPPAAATAVAPAAVAPVAAAAAVAPAAAAVAPVAAAVAPVAPLAAVPVPAQP